MSSNIVNISIPADQVEAVQNYLASLNMQQTNTAEDQTEEQTIDYTIFCGQDCEVKEVLNHRTNRAGTYWEFYIKWANGDKEWISDEECNCEVLISMYLRKQNINTVYVFCRVSTKAQAQEDCVSLDAQLAELLPLAKQSGCQRIKIIKISKGAFKKVPKEMIDICDAAGPGDKLMIYRVDRLSRNIFDFLKEIEEMRKKGVSVYSHQDQLWYTENRTDFAQKILDAQKESELIGKRVKTSIEFRKKRGDHVGNVPYGKMHKKDGNGIVRIVDNPIEIEIIKKVVAMDGYPIDVANYLNVEGIKKRGRFWTPQMVVRLWKDFNERGKRINPM